MNSKTKAHLAVLAANLFFGANFTAIKYITPSHIPPFGLNMVRVAASMILFWLMFAFKPGKPGIDKKDLGRFIVCAATGVAINQLLFVKGLSLTTSIHGALLMLVTPIFITFIAAWLLKERLNIYKVIGLSLGIGGAVNLILMKEGNQHGSDVLMGDILVTINAVAYAFYLVLVRPLMANYSSLHVIRWVFTIGFFMMIPFGMMPTIETDWSAFQWQHWLALGFIITGGTFFAYLFNVYGVQNIGASATGTYIYTQPVFATLIAMWITGEQLNFAKIISAILIFIGVFLANYKAKVKAPVVEE